MRNRRLQGRITAGRFTLPAVILICIVCWIGTSILLPAMSSEKEAGYALWQILTPVANGGNVQWNHIWLLWGVGIISALLVFLAAKNDYRKTYIASYQESNATRLRIADHLRKLPMSFFNTKDLSELTTSLRNR